MNDKDNTFIFKPDEIEILEDKPHVDRSPRDEYSRARITKARKEEEKTSILPYVAVGLAVVLLITVILGVLVLRGNISFRKETEDPPYTARNRGGRRGRTRGRSSRNHSKMGNNL